VGQFKPRFQGEGVVPCQYIDTTRKTIDCATTLPRTVFISKHELTFTFAICYRPSVCRLSVVCPSVCLSSVTFVHPTQARRLKFSAIFLRHWVPWPSIDNNQKFYGDRKRGTPPPGELNTRGVVKYSDFEPIDGYISETVQDSR